MSIIEGLASLPDPYSEGRTRLIHIRLAEIVDELEIELNEQESYDHDTDPDS